MDVGIQVLALAWIVLLAASLQWARVTNRGASIATWLGLTVVTWWLEFVLAFIALHTILFSLGRGAAVVVAIAALVMMSLTPVAWAYGLRHWNNRPSAHS
jgi:hypothetical protein